MSSSCWIFSFMFNHSCFLSMCSFIHDAHDESSSIHQPRFSIQTIVTVVVSWPCNVAFVDPVANHLPRSHPGPVVSSHDLCEAVIPHTEIDWSQQLHSSALLSIVDNKHWDCCWFPAMLAPRCTSFWCQDIEIVSVTMLLMMIMWHVSVSTCVSKLLSGH